MQDSKPFALPTAGSSFARVCSRVYLCNTDGTMPKQHDPSATISEFKSCVNMDVKELEKWLKTKESNEVSLSKAIPLASVASA